MRTLLPSTGQMMLDDSIIHEILSYIDLDEVIRLRLLSRQFNRISLQLYFATVDVGPAKLSQKSKILHVKYSKLVKTIRIQEHADYFEQMLNFGQASVGFPGCEAVLYETYDNDQLTRFILYAQRFTRLRSLVVDSYVPLEDLDDLPDLFDSLVSLTVFCLEDFVLDVLGSGFVFPNMRRFVTDANEVSEEALEVISEVFPGLHKLVIYDFGSVPRRVLYSFNGVTKTPMQIGGLSFDADVVASFEFRAPPSNGRTILRGEATPYDQYTKLMEDLTDLMVQEPRANVLENVSKVEIEASYLRGFTREAFLAALTHVDDISLEVSHVDALKLPQTEFQARVLRLSVDTRLVMPFLKWIVAYVPRVRHLHFNPQGNDFHLEPDHDGEFLGLELFSTLSDRWDLADYIAARSPRLLAVKFKLDDAHSATMRQAYPKVWFETLP